ncbi:la-related protein 6-like [Limulus polyphemus]|uniref:La-related protein 6-like n=1 Tax=Limulus polyphemus TaxID=6850 RepID=A0ABM1BFR7_LIMPO|nr:la-related protein 6-like [Limulus polyphemus]
MVDLSVSGNLDLASSTDQVTVKYQIDSTSSSDSEEYVDAECDENNLIITGSSKKAQNDTAQDFDQPESDNDIDNFKPVDNFEAPSQELVNKIIKEVEYYFSNENLLKDSFLLKHIKRNKQGYVSLKLVASFRKVKRLSKDCEVIAYSLRQSEKLDLNTEGTKIKLKNYLPTNDDKSARSVVAYNLPLGQPSAEHVKELFSKCGDVSQVRILQPGSTIPSDIKCHLSRVESAICAVVEFVKVEAAKKATVELDCTNVDWRSMRVVPLVSKKSKKSLDEGNKKSDCNDKRKKEKRNRIEQLRSNEIAGSGSETDYSIGPRQRSDTGSSSSSGYLSSSPKSSEWIGHHVGKEQQKQTLGLSFHRNNSNLQNGEHKYLTSSTNSWIQRRRENGTPSQVHNSKLIPEGVIRLPHGPNGTKGFNWNAFKSHANIPVTVY